MQILKIVIIIADNNDLIDVLIMEFYVRIELLINIQYSYQY